MTLIPNSAKAKTSHYCSQKPSCLIYCYFSFVDSHNLNVIQTNDQGPQVSNAEITYLRRDVGAQRVPES